jgi:hypothetical protein
MEKGIKITIPEPCAQAWNDLTKVEKGRYCASCEKVVIDFKAMTDKELLDYFKHYQGSVCGSFNPMQLDRIIGENQTKFKSLKYSKFVASLIGLFLSFGLKAQNSDTIKTKILTETAPLSTFGLKEIIVNQEKPNVESPKIELSFRGCLGGVCIQPIVLEDKSKELLKKGFFNRIEDILRYF